MPALTVRAKIFIGVLLLITGIFAVTVGVIVTTVHGDTQASTTASLRDFSKQLDHYRRTEAEAMFAAVAVATDDGSIEELIAKGDAKAIGLAYDRAATDMAGALDLDINVIIDGSGQVLANRSASSTLAAQVKSLRSFHDAMADVSVKDAIEYLGDDAYQIAAEPFYLPNGVRDGHTTSGAIVLGRRVSSILKEFVGEHAGTGLGVALAHEGRVFASDFATADWPLFQNALATRVTGVPSISVAGVNYDFVITPIDACGGNCANVAQIEIFKSREPMEQGWRERKREAFLYLAMTAMVAAIVAWLLSRWVTRPIDAYIDATEALAKGGGDLTRRLDATTKDELGRLAGNLNQVFEQIGKLALEVKGRAHDVAASSDEIVAASRAVLQGAAEQASRIQSTGAATTEMSASIQQVASSAADANEIAKRSGAAIEDAVQRMSEIRTAVDRAAQRMSLLGETNRRIGSIVDTIHQIADQTSLLALNAAIEAAHAGEHGRGFTVVADAVGQLASRVDRSAKEIDELIGQSRAQTEEALEAMASGKREVEVGTKLIADSIDGLRKVLVVFDDTTGAVKEQALASDEIARNMEAVGRIAQDVLHTSQNAVSQGERLTAIADRLEEAVAGLRVEGVVDHERAPALTTPREAPRLRG